MAFISILSRKKKDVQTAERLKRTLTANEYVNVKDVRGSVLYSKDGLLFAFLRIQPISLDLLSPREKEKKIKSFAAEFSSEKKGFKFFSISRPVDISGLSARLTHLLSETADPAQKDLLNHEIREVSAFALTGEVTERQFYLVIWESAGNSSLLPSAKAALSARPAFLPVTDGEKELMRRAHELENRFSGCEIVAELCGQGPIIRLLNLFANPNYAHLEDENVEPTIPFITEKGGVSRNEAV